MEGQAVDAHDVGTGEAVGEAEDAAGGSEEKIAPAPAPATVATCRGREEAEAVAAAAGEGERVEAVGAEQEEWPGRAKDAEVKVAQAADGSRGVAVVVLGWRLHRHEAGERTGKGRGAARARPGGREVRM